MDIGRRAGLAGIVLASLLLWHGGQRANADDLIATQYDGVDDYAIATNVTGGNLGNSAGTFYLWMKRDGIAGLVDSDYLNLLILKTGAGGNSPKVGIGLTVDGKAKIYRYPSHESMPGTTVVTDNQWHFLALTSDGAGTLKLYVDGNLDVSWSRAPWTMNGQTLVLANYYDSYAYSLGTQILLDQVALWSVERTQEQIQADMDTCLSGNEAGLAAYWPMVEGSGGTAANLVGNDQSLSFFDSVVWFQDAELCSSHCCSSSLPPSCEENLTQCESDLALCMAHILPDDDGDGEPNVHDACPNTPGGAEIDQAGCSLVQFCAAVNVSAPQGVRTCKKSDWKNDEPLMSPKEADCRVDRGGPSRADDRCVPHV